MFLDELAKLNGQRILITGPEHVQQGFVDAPQMIHP